VVTDVPNTYPAGPFTNAKMQATIAVGGSMVASSADVKQRRSGRMKAVLPVRVKGRDQAGNAFEEVVHTLDVAQSGVRLGALRRQLNIGDEVTVIYRQRKMVLRVVWTKQMKGTSEFQVGLQAVTQEREAWGLSFAETVPLNSTTANKATGAA
jgi:hypothetical protein